jgi:hypothetical protein
VEFVNNLGPDISAAERRRRKYGFLCQCGIFTNHKEANIPGMEEMAQRVADTALDAIKKMTLDNKQLEEIESSYKLAYVVTIEKEGVKS